MSYNKVQCNALDPDGSLSSIGRGSLIVDRTTLNKKHQHHHHEQRQHHRSSVTTTTSSSSSSSFRRRPITSFHSIGTPPSPTYIDDSPLNDLRRRLAGVEAASSPFGRTPSWRSSRILCEPGRVLGSTSPQSAPAALAMPKYDSGHAQLSRGGGAAAAGLLAALPSSCMKHEVRETTTVTVPEARSSVEGRKNEDLGTARAASDPNRQLTSDKQQNCQKNEPHPLQVVEVVEESKREAPPAGPEQDNGCTLVAGRRRELGSPEPIVEIRQTSSSGSSSASPKSPGQSPSSSRHSSDCEDGSARGTSSGQQNHHQHQHHHSSGSASGSNSSSSSRRLIRRRTVRRSYHHRALETESEPRHSNSLFVTTTTTTTTSPAGERSGRDANSSGQESGSIPTSLETPVDQQRQQQQQQQQQRLTSDQSRLHKLSSSTSSSKIATTSHHKKSTQTSSSSSSSTSRQVVSQAAQKSEQNMILGAEQAKTIDLNSKSESDQQQSLLERRTRLPPPALIERAEAGSVKIEQEEESSVLRRELSSFNTSSRLRRHHQAAASSLACETSSTSSLSRSATKTMSSSSSSSSSTSSTLRDAQQRKLETSTTTKSADLSTASQHQFKSVFLSSSSSAAAAAAATAAAAAAVSNRKSFLQLLEDSNIFSSPDARSFAQELGTDFAELENALSSTSSLVKQQQQQATRSSTSVGFNSSSDLAGASCRFGEAKLRLVHPSRSERPIHEASRRPTSSGTVATTAAPSKNEPESLSGANAPRLTSGQPAGSLLDDRSDAGHDQEPACSYNTGKILELLDKAQRHGGAPAMAGESDGPNASASTGSRNYGAKTGEPASNEDTGVHCRLQEKARCKAVMSEKIERFDQKMSDLCEKLESCNDNQKAIDLMKIMVQMIEKAWSVPVCGDDLGFRLCNSLRQFGGLDTILRFIHEADERSLIVGPDWDSDRMLNTPSSSIDQADCSGEGTQHKTQHKQSKQLRLNLTKIHHHQQQQQQQQQQQPLSSQGQIEANSKSAPIVSSDCPSLVDNDSDILTSDLGLDSTSVESLSYVSATGGGSQAAMRASPPSEDSVNGVAPLNEPATKHSDGADADGATEHRLGDNAESEIRGKRAGAGANEDEDDSGKVKDEEEREEAAAATATTTTTTAAAQERMDDDKEEQEEEEEDMRRVRRDELVFLSAHLLSQCLTSENRDYIVKFGLDPVIKLACNFTTMKSGHSKRLLKRSALMRQSSTMKQRQKDEQGLPPALGDKAEPASNEQTTVKQQHHAYHNPRLQKDGPDNQEQRSDMHSAIGTEILQHLFKHSEETCWRMISLGALQAILYGCRSSHIETLRHCASALANLALYGGPDSQQMMIGQKAHVWLFPLAFNEDDNVQYYACLAIVVLAANQEIEADVLQSSTLDLVDPFVTSHEPRKFAESTTSHIHGQSAGWLKKLMPLLESKREEARNLACFHFAMEAYIKREQGQTSLFKEIGSVELLRKAGGSPIAIASRFACQALRLIGEREPHKLSQQVPLWTCDDVCEWVNQIGFEKFQPAFRDSYVDGDLLLQLDEPQLKFDIGIENGIIRRRFLRELSNLKQIADYSSVDKGGLSAMLVNSTFILNNSLKNTTGNQLVPNMINCPPSTTSSANRNARDFLQYVYPILKIGVTKDNIHLVDCEQLLADCKISNTLHRLKLAHAIHELQDRILLDAASSKRDSLGGEEQKTLDVFVSYRRSTGSQLASLLKVHLQLRGFSVFIDVERLEAGKFDNNLLDSIKTARNFILVLSPNALDRCIGDHDRKDWVHKEIVAAMESKCNIIPIIDNFHWPDPEQLPEDMRSITTFNGIRWIHDYQDACVEKVERFIRGELSNTSCGASSIISSVGGAASGAGGGPGVGPGNQTASVVGNSFQRLTSGCNQSVTNASTPSIIATTPSLCSNQAPYSHQSKSHSSQPSEHHPYAQADGNHHPLGAAYTGNLMQQNLRSGNSNNNVRLQ